MNFLQNVNRIERLHTLILQKKTGNPKELAERLGISRASLYILIDEFNSLNLPVSYSRKLETFYYEREVKLTLSFKVELIDNPDELIKINGGSSNYIFPSKSLDGVNLSLYPYFANTKSHITGF
ncbi:MAG: hypothetical protein PHT07_18130 [Paludibacter sp.]|nr:hypothetical protein [Paludibacter sp.]